jgi:hypothetical protein
MPSDLDDRTAVSKPRPLTKADIDTRMQQLIEEVAAPRGGRGGETESASDAMVPRWIEPAELVRRMSRFLVYN